MAAIAPASVVLMPCPVCGGTPKFTEVDIGTHSLEIAQMLCECGFSGECGSIDNVEGCITGWNKYVAVENHRKIRPRRMSDERS